MQAQISNKEALEGYLQELKIRREVLRLEAEIAEMEAGIAGLRAIPAATAAPEVPAAVAGTLSKVLKAAKAAKSFVTWADAAQVTFGRPFRQGDCGPITTAARKAMEGGDALIVSRDGRYGKGCPVGNHYKTLLSWGYSPSQLPPQK